jgi:hypothetical protein
MSTWRPLVAPLSVLALHALVLRILVETGAVGQVLGAAEQNLAWVAVLAVFYLLRLVAFFVAPGWLLVAMGRMVLARKRRG